MTISTNIQFKKSAKEEPATTPSVFKLMRGYGGCLNPPCRPHLHASKYVLTRASSVQTSEHPLRALLTVFDFEILQLTARLKMYGSYVTPVLTAMGETFRKQQKQLLTLSAQGFQG